MFNLWHVYGIQVIYGMWVIRSDWPICKCKSKVSIFAFNLLFNLLLLKIIGLCKKLVENVLKTLNRGRLKCSLKKSKNWNLFCSGPLSVFYAASYIFFLIYSRLLCKKNSTCDLKNIRPLSRVEHRIDPKIVKLITN